MKRELVEDTYGKDCLLRELKKERDFLKKRKNIFVMSELLHREWRIAAAQQEYRGSFQCPCWQCYWAQYSDKGRI